MSRARRSHVAVGALLAVFAAGLAVAQLSIYADRVLFDSGRFADRAQSALQEQAVRTEAGRLVSDALLRADPDLITIEPVLRSAAEGVAGSRPFALLVRGAAYQLHSSVFSGESDTFALTAANAAVLVVEALRAQGLEAASGVGDVETRLVSISDGPAGNVVTDLVQIGESIGPLIWIAMALALVSLAGAAVLSPDKRVLVRRAGLVTALLGGILVTAYLVARAAVTGQARDPSAADALRDVWDAYLGDLRTWSAVLAGAGLVVAAAADSVLRPVGVAERLRTLARAAATTPARAPLRAMRAVALVAAGIVVVAAPDAALQLAILAGGVALIAVGVEEVLRLTAPASAPGEPTTAAGGLRRVLVPAAVAAVALAGLASLAIAAGDTDDDPGALVSGCNGSPALCDRRVDQVTFAATHNSMSAPRKGFLFPNQEAGIARQLADGVRGLLIDTHLGVETEKGVYTILAEGGKSRGKVEGAIGRQATRRAERLREQIGYTGGGDPRVYLCHGFCEIGSTLATAALTEVRDFLVANPGEVLVISIEDQVTPGQTAAVFEQSGLLDLVWRGSVRPLPTLREMIDRNQRVLVMGEEDTAGVDWYHQQFDLVQETPFDVPSATRLLSDESCRRNRGAEGNPVLLVNHFLTPPRPSKAREVNGAADVARHASACADVLGAPPTLLAVDFYQEGDVVGAARSLNERRGEG